MRIYDFNYDFYQASATFVVDTEVFFSETAISLLTTMGCDYDEKSNPIDEVMKKYAIEALKSCTFNNYDVEGVIKDFESKEIFTKIDGSQGITLTKVSPYEIAEEYLAFRLTCE